MHSVVIVLLGIAGMSFGWFIYSRFIANRNTSERDRAIPTIDTGEKVDVYGGWNDAGGETGKCAG